MAIFYPHLKSRNLTKTPASLPILLRLLFLHTSHSDASNYVFEGTGERDLVSWTATISSLANGANKDKGNAIGAFNSMLWHGVRPNHVTVLCLINAVRAVWSRSDEVRQWRWRWRRRLGGLHGTVFKFGFGAELSVVTALLGFYSSMGEVEEVRKLFQQSPYKDLILWTALVSALSKNTLYVESIDVFRKMRASGMLPNDACIVSVLPACANSGALLLGKQIHGFAIKNKELYSETKIHNSLVDLYVKSNQLDLSISVFNMIPEKDGISWKTIICGCTDTGNPKRSLHFFLGMRRSSNIIPGASMVCSILNVASKMDNDIGLRLGSSLHCYIIRVNSCNSISVGTSLLRMYSKFGEMDISHRLFHQLPHRDLTAWTAMISVYARGDTPFLALELCKQMQQQGIEPNDMNLVAVLQACTAMRSKHVGGTIHGRVIRFGFSNNMHLTSCLIDFYCKLGSFWQGEVLFEKFQPKKDIVCWSSMINGYGFNGRGEEAIGMFQEMLKQGILPNQVTFIALLSSCSHSGLVDEGWKWFKSMERYGLSPSMEHYSCMVDMLSRQGHVNQAIDLISKMPMEPDVVIWASVLSGCREAHGDVEAVEIAASRFFRLDWKNTSYYVALSNMYANLGKWLDVERTRRFVDINHLRKTGGYSINMV
ncbi:hypothetical protein ZOSMA_26G00980 [Zostera marina]|uniref:Pentatricopeptide repeat-containing protein n=1 Tax=Zostera marina TaxID=29655 RepID=A0A0K9PEF1_ZOSMR|nr:hypothetical protein ZOSMA_26G00980 [Zostera marina]